MIGLMQYIRTQIMMNGPWTSVSYVNPASREERPNLCYPIYNPITGQAIEHPTNAWKYEKATYEQHVKDKKTILGTRW